MQAKPRQQMHRILSQERGRRNAAEYVQVVAMMVVCSLMITISLAMLPGHPSPDEPAEPASSQAGATDNTAAIPPPGAVASY